MIWYILNVKNKGLGEISKFIIFFFKNNNKLKNTKKKIIIINENLIKFIDSKYKKKFFYKHSGYLGGLKKKNFIDIYKKNKKELIKNSLLKMLKNYKIKKNIFKILFFLKEIKSINKIKSKIIYF
ncbi:MAG: uL13 family ribosomal protein [Candidatus Nasuia deltocephalinicola]